MTHQAKCIENVNSIFQVPIDAGPDLYLLSKQKGKYITYKLTQDFGVEYDGSQADLGYKTSKLQTTRGTEKHDFKINILKGSKNVGEGVVNMEIN